jgi:cysteine desulfurase/selenocysteine lyase
VSDLPKKVVEERADNKVASGGPRRWTAESLRPEFPILATKVRGKPLVYLDNAATTQKPEAVLRALDGFYRTSNANIHRGIHWLSEQATLSYEAAREKVRRFLDAETAESIVFTRGTTESINLVAYAWGRKNVRAGDEIVLSAMEHHSNLVPWQILAKEKGARLEVVPLLADGTLDMEALGRALRSPRARLLAITAASNVLGTLTPVEEICRLARERGIVSLVDGAQSAPHMPTSVRRIGCDFFAFSGHKMAGPTGAGALYGRREILEAMDPFLGGGEMISSVSFDESTWNELPWKFEAGTMNIAQAIGLGAAIDYMEGLGMEAVRAHEQKLAAHALARLDEAGCEIYGPREAERRTGVVAFNVPGIHPHDLAQMLDHEGIAVRAGHHCAMPLARILGVAATARASFFVYNTEAEIDALIEGIEAAKKFFL